MRRASSALFGRGGRGKASAKVTPAEAPSDIAVGGKLSERMWIQGLDPETLDVRDQKLDAVWTKAAASLGGGTVARHS